MKRQLPAVVGWGCGVSCEGMYQVKKAFGGKLKVKKVLFRRSQGMVTG